MINYLLDNDCNCWQSELVKKSNMTDSKISRLLTKLEASGIISRVRDGMGNRVNLHKVELL
ncbi:MAG: helix-turn-helix transcriptional regulator [Candidatus Thalassarchaeaceae archaeon]